MVAKIAAFVRNSGPPPPVQTVRKVYRPGTDRTPGRAIGRIPGAWGATRRKILFSRDRALFTTSVFPGAQRKNRPTCPMRPQIPALSQRPSIPDNSEYRADGQMWPIPARQIPKSQNAQIEKGANVLTGAAHALYLRAPTTPPPTRRRVELRPSPERHFNMSRRTPEHRLSPTCRHLQIDIADAPPWR